MSPVRPSSIETEELTSDWIEAPVQIDWPGSSAAGCNAATEEDNKKIRQDKISKYILLFFKIIK